MIISGEVSSLWEVVSLRGGGVCGDFGEVRSPAWSNATDPELCQTLSELAVTVTSESSLLWFRVFGTAMPSRTSELDNLGRPRNPGDGGKGEIGEWKEWKDSALDERLSVLSSMSGFWTWSSVVSEGGVVRNDNWGGAVVARPVLSVLGRVGVLKGSTNPRCSLERCLGVESESSVAWLS